MDQYAAQSHSDFENYYDEPPKTSVLAILSLVCSLICFIPGLSAIGALLGVFGLIRITSSNGRIKGTGLAVAGIAVGVVVSLLWIGAAVALQQGTNQYVAFGQVVTEIDANNYDAARGKMTTETRALATDEKLSAFKANYEAEVGELTGWPEGALGVFGAFMDLGRSGQQPDDSQIPYANPVPLPGEFGGTDYLVWFIIDQSGQLDDSSRYPAIINVAISAADGTPIWMIDPDELKAGANTGAGTDESPDENAEPAEEGPRGETVNDTNSDTEPPAEGEG